MVPASNNHTPRMQAKWFKILGHKLFPDGKLLLLNDKLPVELQKKQYNAIIWIDGSFEVTSPKFAEDLTQMLGVNDALFFPHCLRSCIFEEAETLLSIPKFQGLKINEQMNAYFADGMRSPTGLFECSIIARSTPHRPAAAQMEDMWWKEINERTYRDQLSLPYVLSKVSVEISVSPYTVYDNPWTKFSHHLIDS
ncbi:DUF616 domain-containing protein [Methylobacterium sp. NI91]|nr:DUF616 domain-containing protein [Methylobacterium sp. CLZ]QIJ82039.1 DUF616 domain-containing protein [Methylobacterium sp. NI91]